MDCKAYLFDFDGTLVDSMPSWSAKMLNILKKTGVSYPVDVIKRITPLGDAGTARYFRETLGVPLSEAEMFEMMDEFALPRYRDTIGLKDGVLTYLLRLKRRGCSLNVLTASPHKMLDVCLKRNGIWELFDHVWSCDDFGTTKSDPGLYARTARLMGVEVGETVFFDDNLLAVQTAAKAGMRTVGVYDPSGADFRTELEAIADRYVTRLDELTGFETFDKGDRTVEPKKIIFDTDIGGDCDDVVALDLLISAHQQGLCKLVGVSCTSFMAEGVGCARAILKTRGMEQVPLAAMKARDNAEHWYGTAVARAFPELARMELPAEAPVAALRRWIGENPGVTVVVVGDMTNVADLLTSGPDAVSPLTGVELVRQNVAAFAVMAGDFSHQLDPALQPKPEWNVICNIPGACTFFELCPTDVFILPFEAGQDVLSGRILAQKAADRPDGLAIIAHGSGERGRSSWDPMTVLYTVWGEKPWFNLSKGGKVAVVPENGVTTLEEYEGGRHFVLRNAVSNEEIGAFIDGEIEKIL